MALTRVIEPFGEKVLQTCSRSKKVSVCRLGISCRTPFEHQILTTASRRQFIEVSHEDSKRSNLMHSVSFFAFIRFSNPHVPLLAAEYSRPLFLKILCTTFAGLTATSKSRRIRDFAAGQKGMTKLFEDFINSIGRAIESDFGLVGKTCWRILKGQTATSSGKLVGVAASMAGRLKDSLSLEECDLL